MRRKKSKMIRLPKKVYKYFVSFYFGGDIQKVLVQQEGKKEAIIEKYPLIGGQKVSIRIKKVTKTEILCDTLEEAKELLIEFLLNQIKKEKKEIKKLNTKIKETKNIGPRLSAGDNIILSCDGIEKKH